jgi:hypothetical protein
MNHDEAAKLVVAATRRDQPGLTENLTDLAVLEIVYDTLSYDTLVDYDDDETEAYRVVLVTRRVPTRGELIELLTALTQEGFANLTTAQRVWADRAERNELA